VDITLKHEWNGHGECKIAVCENGYIVARFDTEDEARQWAADEYNIDSNTIAWG